MSSAAPAMTVRSSPSTSILSRPTGNSSSAESASSVVHGPRIRSLIRNALSVLQRTEGTVLGYEELNLADRIPAAVRRVRMRSVRPLAATFASSRAHVPGAGSRATTGANRAQARLCKPMLAPTSRMQRPG
jgi:hypothetical protein